MTRVAKRLQTLAATTVLTPTQTAVKFFFRTFAATTTITPAIQKRITKTVALATTLLPATTSLRKYFRTAAATTTLMPTEQHVKIPGGPFNPSHIAGLKMWLDASQLALVDGADVDSFPNLASGGAATVINGTPLPNKRKNAPTGKSVVRFFTNGGRLRTPSSGFDKE